MKTETLDTAVKGSVWQAVLLPRVLFNYLPNFFVLLGGMLIAVQVRLELPVGKALGQGYEAEPRLLYPLLALGAALATGATFFTLGQDKLKAGISQRTKFSTVVLGLALSSILIAILLPQFSQLQLFYFIAFSLLIGLVTIIAPPRLYSFGERRSVFYYLKQVWDNRILLGIFVYYNVRSRYSQTILGILWIILLPLSTSLILAFVFSQILRIVETGGVPFVAFFLVGYTSWSLFSQGIISGTTSLMVSIGLITQVYFPREILVIVKLGEALVDFTFMLVAMLIINLALGISITATFLYLPILVLLQLALLAGFMLFLSYLSIIVRDIPQLIAVGMQLLFYLTPILYPISMVPERYHFIMLLNPMAPIIDAYRAILLYNQAPSWGSLHYPLVLAAVLIYVGYKFFKANERHVADYV